MFEAILSSRLLRLEIGFPLSKAVASILSTLHGEVVGLGFDYTPRSWPLIGCLLRDESKDCRCVVATSGSGRPCKVSDSACTAATVFHERIGQDSRK